MTDAREQVIAGLKAAIGDPYCPLKYSPLLIQACRLLAISPPEPTEEVRGALQKLMDCSRAIVGADQKDDRSAEAFDMFWAAHAAARAALRATHTSGERTKGE